MKNLFFTKDQAFLPDFCGEIFPGKLSLLPATEFKWGI